VQSLREHAKHRAEELASLENRHKDLAEHREDLIEQAKRQGRQAEAVIATADNLLKSGESFISRRVGANLSPRPGCCARPRSWDLKHRKVMTELWNLVSPCNVIPNPQHETGSQIIEARLNLCNISAREMSQKGAERASSATGEYKAVSKSER